VSAATLTAPTRSEPVARPGFWRGMLWLTWRQHRWQIIVGAAVTVGMLLWMMSTAHEITTALAQCPGDVCARGAGADRQDQLNRGYSFATYELNTVTFLPLGLGLFWGVPVLAREYEQRTLMLAWSQDVSPLKWLWSKLAILGVAATALGTALAAEAEHLAYLAHLAGQRSLFEGTLFQGGGWLPLTLGLAWFAFGVAVGTVARRMLPALAVVFAAFIGRTVLMARYRADFMTPLTTVKSFTANLTSAKTGGAVAPAVSNDMSVSSFFADASGHSVPGGQDIFSSCVTGYTGTSLDPPATYMTKCMQQHGIVSSIAQYQPATRMGTFHLIENGMNLSLLVLSLVVTWWFVRRARTTT
jgi:hypothetical protein